MDWQETIKISKLEAARRQIDTAVRLYFDEGDPVAIHTLASAGFEILRDLDKHGLNTGTFYDWLAKRSAMGPASWPRRRQYILSLRLAH